MNFVRCNKSWMIKSQEYLTGEVYAIENDAEYEYLLGFHVQSGPGHVYLFEEATQAEFDRKKVAIEEATALEARTTEDGVELEEDRPNWPIKTDPVTYLQRNPKGPRAVLARTVVAWDAANAPDEDEDEDE